MLKEYIYNGESEEELKEKLKNIFGESCPHKHCRFYIFGIRDIISKRNYEGIFNKAAGESCDAYTYTPEFCYRVQTSLKNPVIITFFNFRKEHIFYLLFFTTTKFHP